MVMVRRIAVLAAAAAISLSGAGATPARAAEKPPKVDWSSYSPAVKPRIKALAKAKDCSALQAEFDTADANDELQRKRTGTGNTQLMAYLDFKLRKAGCYR